MAGNTLANGHPEKPRRSILIKGGRVVNADKSEDVDVLIDNGIVKDMSYDIQPPSGCEVLSAEGLLVIPGGIDPHTHLEFEYMGTRTADDFVNGTKAAVAGGTTMIIDFAIPAPDQSLLEIYETYRKKADGRVCCDYSLHLGLTHWSDRVANEMEVLCGKHGVNSFKMYMAYKDSLMVDDGILFDAFTKCRELGAIPMVHAENGHVIEKNTNKLLSTGITGPEGHELSRPEDLEAEATNRAAMIASQTDAPLYVVHVMSEAAAKVIAERRAAGQTNLYGETLAAALGTSPPDLHCEFSVAAGHVMSPPIRRNPNNSVALVNFLASNVLQTTGSDNCTYNKEQKALGRDNFTKIPNGINGVEDRMSIVWDRGVDKGIIDPQRFVEITSTNVAKIFNLYPKKGCIEIGSDADIVIWNPMKSRKISAETHHHACDFNIFEGLLVHGVADTVIVKGRICYQNSQLREQVGLGSFVPCPVFAPHVYGRRVGLRNGIRDNDTSPAIPLGVLNFQERQLLWSALNKASKTSYKGCSNLFKELDQKGRGRLKQSEFSKVLQTIGVLQNLSSRESEALMKGFARQSSTDFEIDYQQFVKACTDYHRQPYGDLTP